MKIVIEAQRIFRRNKHGMDFVALETIRNLQRLDKENQYYVLVKPGEDRCLEPAPNFEIMELKCPSYPLWEQVALPLAIRSIRPDVVHCTSNTAPVWCPAPLVVTLHDIIFLEKRSAANASLYQALGWYYRRMVVPRILPHCRKIITVSDFERGRILGALGLPPEDVAVVYNGFADHFRPLGKTSRVASKYLSDSSYLFFMGNTDPKKNTVGTLRAYAAYLKRSAVKRPLLIAELDAKYVGRILKENGIEFVAPYLRYSGYIPNTELPYIYNGAFAFLYTSLRESFGIPILEAMACGTPVVTSATSSMPEVAGEGALTANPSDAEQIAEILLRLEADKMFYEEQVRYGLDRVGRFSWKHTAEQTLAIYRQLADEGADLGILRH